jgi:UPF0716 protein FxsA
MRRILLLLFIIVPALEMYTIIQVGSAIGGWPTFLLIIGMGFMGAYLLKRQGLRTLQQIRDELSMGIPPGDTLLEGACILIGGTLLLSPGFLTDIIGVLLLIPFLRRPVKALLKRWLLRLMQSRRFTIYRP